MVSHDQESLTGFLLTGLSYPDEKVKSVCAFILAHAITSPAEGDRQLFWARNGDLPSSVLSLLATGQSKELRVNALGLLKKLLEHEEPARILMQYQGKTSLSSVIKKMLMSRDDTLQVTSVQCTAQILLHQKAQLSHHCQYAEELLNSDVAEFLYETLATVNGLLLSSTFCCLLLLTEIDSFFSKCHTVYGIESIVRAVQQSAKLNNTEALNQGLKLLSEIFKKQPGDIHLMNNDSTLTQLTLTLTDCMTHTETPTVTHATQALADLLRRDQLPSPLPFQTLITTLQALLDVFHRLPKPLVGHSHRGHHGCSLRGHSRQEGLGRSHSKQEMLLNTGLGALHKAFRLAAACLNDPTTTESQFTAPNSQDTKATDAGLSCLIQFLLQAVEGTCIPLVMMNIETISIPHIFTSLFSMLCVAMEFDVGDINKFAVKLVSSFFIQLAITIRNKFPTQDRLLQDAINCFLVGLCTSIQDPRFALEEKQELRDTLQKALPHIHGSADEMLPLLHEVPPSASSSSSSLLGQDDVDSALHIKQQACLALLYYAFLYHDKLAPESAVSEAVVSFLTNHSNLKRLPTSTAKHLLLLLAMCHGKGWDQPMHSGVLSFLKVLQERDITRVYTHHPSILNWCFGPASPPSQFAQGIIEQWLLCSRSGNKAEATEAWQQGGEGDILSNLLRSNPTCLDMLLDIMSSGGNGLVQEALAVLESVFNGAASSASDEESTQSLLVALRKRLPDVVQRIFMSEEEAPLDVHILALLRLRCTLLERCPRTELDPTDIKLMYHVINLISKSTNSNPNILQVSLNYLTCLLIQTSTQEETRVVSILLSNTSILQLLESLVSSDSPSQLHTQQCSSLSLVTQIITGQAKFNIRVSHTMTLELRFAMDLMRQNKDRLRKVCGLQLWTALFNAKFESPVLRITCKSALRTLREDEDIGLDIQARDLKSVYVWLQNSIVQGNPLLCQAAVSCMRSLIAYLLGRSQTLAHHLLAQPWNHRLINYCLESNLDSNHVPTYVIQLITMFLQHGKREKMVSIQHLQGMTDYLKSLDISQCMNQQAVLDALLMVQQVIVQPDVKVTLNIVQGLGAFLQQVTNPAKYQSLERQDDLKCVRLNGVVLQHPRSYTMDSKMISPPAHQIPFLAKDLLEKLTRYKE
ncbi:meiosis inhibitor protein 1-like isoform X2 [Acanthaster planci]|nr:meiosis inhibitor protein 1-like isoform X2 [Acanthaster planci]